MVEVVAALIWENDMFMICQRPAHKTRGLLWEFVGGKVEPGETREQALIRECKEELDILILAEGADGLDEADGADGDEILNGDTGILKAAGDIDHQAQVSLNEALLGGLLPLLAAAQKLLRLVEFRKTYAGGDSDED